MVGVMVPMLVASLAVLLADLRGEKLDAKMVVSLVHWWVDLMVAVLDFLKVDQMAGSLEYMMADCLVACLVVSMVYWMVE